MKRGFHKSIIIAVIMAFSFSTTAVMAANTKADDIRKLLEVTGAMKLGYQVASAVLQNMIAAVEAQSKKPMPERQVIILQEEIMRELGHVEPQMIAKIVSIYEKNFTQEDIQNMLAFYGTATGRKTVRKMPIIMQESMASGQDMIKEMNIKAVAERFKKRVNGS